MRVNRKVAPNKLSDLAVLLIEPIAKMAEGSSEIK
jgi:hypothetical protein